MYLVDLSHVPAGTNVITPSTRRVLPGCGITQAKHLSEDGYVGDRYRIGLVPELQRPPSSRSGRTIACTSCYYCHLTPFHHYSTRRVLSRRGSTLPKSPSEDGYVGGRSRSCNGLRPHDLVELSPVPAATIIISPCCTTTALGGVWPAAVAPCPSLPLKTVTLVVGPGASTASVPTIWLNYCLYQLLLLSFHPVSPLQHSPGPVPTR